MEINVLTSRNDQIVKIRMEFDIFRLKNESEMFQKTYKISSYMLYIYQSRPNTGPLKRAITHLQTDCVCHMMRI